MTHALPSSPPPSPGLGPLFDAAAMGDADRRATEDHAMPSILLMERAGLADYANARRELRQAQPRAEF